MRTSGVMVCPVDHTAFVVPFIFTIETYPVANLQRTEPWCDVYVVSDQQSLITVQSQYEALMAIAYQIVGKDLRDHACTLNLKIA